MFVVRLLLYMFIKIGINKIFGSSIFFYTISIIWLMFRDTFTSRPNIFVILLDQHDYMLDHSYERT